MVRFFPFQSQFDSFFSHNLDFCEYQKGEHRQLTHLVWTLQSKNYYFTGDYTSVALQKKKKSWQFGWEFCSEYGSSIVEVSKAVLNTDFLPSSIKVTKGWDMTRGRPLQYVCNEITYIVTLGRDMFIWKRKRGKKLPISFGFMTSVRSIFRGIQYVLPQPTAKATKTEQLKSTLNSQVYK